VQSIRVDSSGLDAQTGKGQACMWPAASRQAGLWAASSILVAQLHQGREAKRVSVKQGEKEGGMQVLF